MVQLASARYKVEFDHWLVAFRGCVWLPWVRKARGQVALGGSQREVVKLDHLAGQRYKVGFDLSGRSLP